MPSKKYEIKIDENNFQNRADVLITGNVEGVSRSYAAKLIESGNVCLNGAKKIDKPSHKFEPGQIMTVYIPEAEKLDAKPENIDIDIVFEDKDILIINKKPGMVVHPSAGHSKGTLVNAVLFHADSLSSIGGVVRPGIVHRLDKDTSGLILIAKNDMAHQKLSEDFKSRNVKKTYYAIVCGEIYKKRFAVNLPIGRSETDRKKMAVIDAGSVRKSREAYTDFEAVQLKKGFTLVKAMPRTGRTHQIRVHLSHVGFPIAGDRIYTPENILRTLKKEAPDRISRLWLHAEGLSFRHPRTGKTLEFHTDLPEEFDNFFKKI